MPERIDKVILARGLASSRERAQGLVTAGLVLVNGEAAQRSSQMVEDDAVIEVTGEALPYVGKGGTKMEAALKRFRLNVRGSLCLDVGASTGGFTDCLLQRGAAKVVAVDVGHGQLAPSLLSDSRVELREGLNARHITPDQFTERFDLAVIDVSFISLTLVLPAIAPLVRNGGHILALVKPEFEAGRQAVGARGIVRSQQARQRSIDKIMAFSRDQLSLEVRGAMESPKTGGGNREYFVCLRRPEEPTEEPPVPPADSAPVSE